MYNFYYNQRRIKPFTFGVYFPGSKKDNNEKFNVGNLAILNFYTSSLELASFVYNGFRNIENHIWKSNGDEINFKSLRAHLNKDKKILDNEVTVKTLSPLLVNKIGSSNKFLLPDEEGFLEGLKFSLRECVRDFLNYIDDFEFEIIIHEWKMKVIYHYQKMPGVVRVFTIRAKPEILQMIYDIGLGVHRSQGFGLLEVIK